MDSGFIPVEKLTKRPQALNELEIDPLVVAQIAENEATVLHLWIDRSGIVVNVFAEKSGMPDDLMQTVMEAFRRVRFIPGELLGERQGATMRVEVRYDAPAPLDP